MAILNNSNAISSGGYDINNSLRFRASASAYLQRTPSVTGSLTTWTASFWYKNGAIDSNQTLFSNATASDSIGFRSSRTVEIYFGAGSANLVTTQVFRDVAAWYHIVVAVDTTQATAANRIKLYVNGTQVTAFSTATYPAQNYQTSFNRSGFNQEIGRRSSNTDLFLDGYMAEINWVDGQALTPSSFGETDTTTGVWKPKAYTGTYGTNGFYLKFSDIATTSGSNAGLGKDFSGNTNYWTTNNISVTAGTTYDAMTDVPTNTSATVANYAVLNPLNLASSGVTSTNANLLATSTGAAYRSLTSTIDLPTGSWYFEITAGASSAGDNVMVGIQSVTENLQSNYVGSSATSYGYGSGGKKYNAGTGVTYGATWTSGDVIGIAFNGSTLTFYKNNTSQGNAYTGLSGNFVFVVSAYSSSASVNFGQRPFAYTPPTGYVRLNTYNLPTSTIVQGNKYMDATLYTGNGFPTSGTQSITNAGAFKPDFVWIKDRSSGTNYHALFDSIRGINNRLFSNTTDSQNTTTGTLTAFNSNGFTLGSQEGQNANGNAIVAWQWQAGQGSTSSNTSGSITSTVSVNATAGFSIVTYTGNATSGATVGHGLGVAPRFIIAKNRSSGVTDWPTYHISTGNNGGCTLNEALAKATTAIWWNNTTPTSTLVTLGSGAQTNGSGNSQLLYCWAEIAGFSKFGSYTGNGSTDGPFVYTGFRPKFVILKNSSAVGGWVILDTSRNTYNVAGNELYPNSSAAEGTGYTDADFLSNGFKLRVAADPNASSGAYIYMAFAENPTKYALAR